MINFFRKHTSHLKTNWFNYGLDTVVVIIGILIALGVNNWNDHRVKKSEISNIYLSIIEELENDIQILDEYLPEYYWKNKMMKRIIYDDISLDEWTQNDSLFSSFVSYPDFGIGQERFQMLKTKVALNDETKKLNRRISDFYHKHIVNLEVKTNEAFLSFNRNVSYWEENEEWFSYAYADKEYSKLGTCAINNPIFRNKILWYRIVLMRLENALREYQTEAKLLIEDIRNHLDSQK